MPSKQQSCNSLSHTIARAAASALVLTIVLGLTVVLTLSAQAQTFKVVLTSPAVRTARIRLGD